MKASSKLTLAQRELVLEHHAFAKRLAQAFYRQRQRGDLDYEDFEGAAMLGLCHAATRFDPTRGQAFSIYAHRRIRGSMIDLLRSIGSLPRMYFMKDDEETVEEQPLPYTYTANELAGIVNSSGALNIHIHSSTPDFETQLSYSNAVTPEDALANADARSRVRNLLEVLPERQRSVMQQYYFEDTILADMREVASGSSKGWLCRLHHKGLKRLRKSVMNDPELRRSLSCMAIS